MTELEICLAIGLSASTVVALLLGLVWGCHMGKEDSAYDERAMSRIRAERDRMVKDVSYWIGQVHQMNDCFTQRGEDIEWAIRRINWLAQAQEAASQLDSVGTLAMRRHYKAQGLRRALRILKEETRGEVRSTSKAGDHVAEVHGEPWQPMACPIPPRPHQPSRPADKL